MLPVDKIIEMRINFYSPAEIAKKLGLSNKQVSRKLWKLAKFKGYKFPSLADKVSDNEIKEILFLYKNGWSAADISERIKRSKTCVSEKLKNCGIILERRHPLIGDYKCGHDEFSRMRDKNGEYKCSICVKEKLDKREKRDRFCPNGHEKTEKNRILLGFRERDGKPRYRCKKCANFQISKYRKNKILKNKLAMAIAMRKMDLCQ